MAQRYRLLARAFMDGALRDPGYVFTLAEGETGPHRTVEHGTDQVDLDPNSEGYGNTKPGALRDVPLYEEIRDDVELGPNVSVGPGISMNDGALGGGTMKMEDERRLKELDEKGDLSDEERTERDEIAARQGRPPSTSEHTGPAYDPADRPLTTPTPDKDNHAVAPAAEGHRPDDPHDEHNVGTEPNRPLTGEHDSEKASDLH